MLLQNFLSRRNFISTRLYVLPDWCRRSSSFVQCATFMETLRLCNFCNFGATLLGFGIVFTNIILLWIRNSEKNWATPTPKKTKKKNKK